ncbi:MAG: ABC transporter permease [Rhodobacteraceae bacterium]|nr:ABC transporter permease [Paracoccaceae bacterium]
MTRGEEAATASDITPGHRTTAEVLGRWLGPAAWPISLAVLILGLQWYIPVAEVSPAVFPAPFSIWTAFRADLMDGTYMTHGVVTMREILGGFVIGSVFGFLLAMSISEFRWARRVLYPYVVVFQTIPKIALAPLFIVWFGFGIESKIALGVAVTFFPVLVNSLAGLDNVDPTQMDLMRAFCGTRMRIFLRVKLPTSVPFVFAGLELAIVLSVIAAVVAEFIGASRGLGYLVMLYNSQLNIAAEFAAIIVLSLIGFLLHAAVRQISRRVVYWQ